MPILFIIKQESQTAEIYSGGACLETFSFSSSIPGSTFGKVPFARNGWLFFALNSSNTN